MLDAGAAATGMWVTAAAAPVVVTVLAWSIRRNVAGLDKSISAVAADVRQLTSQVGGHAASLAVGDERHRNHETRITGLEQRERYRCVSCRVDQGLPALTPLPPREG